MALTGHPILGDPQYGYGYASQSAKGRAAKGDDSAPSITVEACDEADEECISAEEAPAREGPGDEEGSATLAQVRMTGSRLLIHALRL